MKRYEETAARNEFRWGAPQGNSVINRTVATLKKAGVDGWVCSGVDGYGTPLFPSAVYPSSHPGANRRWLEYLLAKAEHAGITVVSWYPLNLAKPVVEKHPDYRMQFLDWGHPADAALSETSARHYACLNSPYLDLLARFCQELIRIGFKGIWFDGNTIALHGGSPSFQPGCRCRYCVDSFRKETGEALPMAVDFRNPVFKRWLVWRYAILERAWARLAAAVKSVNPDATVCLNNYRRRRMSWTTGIPMKELNLDVLMSGELDDFLGQGDFQMKMHEAMQCRRGRETWVPMSSYHWEGWLGNPEPETMLQGALGAVGSGGNVFCGTDNLSTIRGCMPHIARRVKPLWEFRGGKRLRYAAIWVSQRSMDFDGQMNAGPYWNMVHGANELLNHAHLQGGVVFDDNAEAKRLREYPVVIAGENSCVSQRQWRNLLGYVRSGGLLVASGRFAAQDEWGLPRKDNPLHALLGIRGSEERKESMVYGRFHPRSSPGDYPETIFCGNSGFQRLTLHRASGLTVLARSRTRSEKNESPGILLKELGRGWILYLNTDIFSQYATVPVRYQMELIRRILTLLAPPALEIHAPMAVTANTFEKSDEFVLHLHNHPGVAYRHPYGGCVQGEIPPALGISCNIARLAVREAIRARNGARLPLTDGVFFLDRVDDYEVVRLKKRS